MLSKSAFSFGSRKYPARREVVELDRLRIAGGRVKEHAWLQSKPTHGGKADVGVRIFGYDFQFVPVAQIDPNQSSLSRNATPKQ